MKLFVRKNQNLTETEVEIRCKERTDRMNDVLLEFRKEQKWDEEE